MSWFVLSLIYVVLASFGNIFRKILLRDDKSDAVGAAIIFQWLGCAICIIVAFWHGFHMPPVREYPVNFLLNMTLWGCATLFLFKAYKHVEASEVTILLTLESIVTIVTATSFLHESFSFINAIGAFLIIVSVITLSQVSGKMKFNKGVIYAIASSLFAGVAVVNDTFIIKHSDTLSYLVIGFFLPGLFILITNPTVIKRMKPLFQPVLLLKNFIFTTFITIAAIAFYIAVASGGEISQVNAIAQSSVVLTVLLAAIFLRERDHLLKKFICAILVTIGVLLL